MQKQTSRAEHLDEVGGATAHVASSNASSEHENFATAPLHYTFTVLVDGVRYG